MAFVSLDDDVEDTSEVAWQDTETVKLSDAVFDSISGERLRDEHDLFAELRVQHLPVVDRDEGYHVRVDLGDDEGVHVEELRQSLHGQVLADRAVDKLHPE